MNFKSYKYCRLTSLPDGQTTNPHDSFKEMTSTPGADRKWCFIWRGISLIMAVFFLLAAYVNVNDPDWYLWVPIYLIPALFSTSVVISPSVTDNIVWRVLSVIFIALNIAHAAYLGILVIEVLNGRIENPAQHEEGRELAGTVIIIIWMVVSTFTSFGSSKPGQGAMNMLLLVTVMFGTLPLFLWGLCFVGDWHTKIGHCKDMF